MEEFKGQLYQGDIKASGTIEGNRVTAQITDRKGRTQAITYLLGADDRIDADTIILDGVPVQSARDSIKIISRAGLVQQILNARGAPKIPTRA